MPTDGFLASSSNSPAQLIGTNTGNEDRLRLEIGSFDTHGGQRAQQDRLLGYLGNGLLAFLQGSRGTRQRQTVALR